MGSVLRSKRLRVVGRWILVILLLATPISAATHDRPSAFFLLIDLSSSMTEKPSAATATDWTDSKLVEVKRQLGDFVASLPAETFVSIWTFHEELFAGPELTITSEKDRDQLREYFATLEAPGKQTHLWSSSDAVLAKARAIAQAMPGRPIRFVIYTDGLDNQPNGPSPATVLNRYQDLIKDQVEVTLLTIGFSLEAPQRETLEQYNVRVRPSLSPADIIPLVPSFSWEPTRPTAGDTVQFVDRSGGVIKMYRWDFGNNDERSSEKAPRYVYEKPGDYIVTLGLKSPTGETAIERRTIRVASTQPLKAAFKTPPATVPAGTPVYFVNESQGSIAAYHWTFDDETSSNEQHPVHVYEIPGVYSPTLTVTGTKGDTDSFKITSAIQIVGPKPPTVDFFSAEHATVGESVQFFAQTTGLVDELQWSIDDELVSSESNLGYTFEQPGEPIVKLTVRGPGGESSKTRTIEVAAITPPVASLIVGATSPRTGDEVVFTDTTTGPVDYVIWKLGEAEPVRVDYRNTPKVSSKAIKHVYSKPGEYAVTLTAFGPGGQNTAEDVVTVTSKWLPPVARFTADQTTGRGKLTVRFKNESEGTVEKYVWSFNDGSEDVVLTSAEDVEHTFKPGKREVILTAIGPEAFAESRHSETIDVGDPLPGWLKHLLWAVPAGVVLLVLSGVGYRKLKQMQSETELAIVSGQVWCKPSNNGNVSWNVIQVTGDSDAFKFDPAAAHSGNGEDVEHAVEAMLRVNLDADTREPAYAIELYRDTELIDSYPVEPDEDVQLGGYTFRYLP